MKLLQISEYFTIDVNKIIYIEEEDDTSCWIRVLGIEFKLFCDRYNAQQLMSKICEEVYYGNDGIRKDD